VLRFILRRMLSGIIVLLLITYVSFLAQEFAMRSRSNQAAPVGEVASRAFGAAVRMLRQLLRRDLGAYVRPVGSWGRSEGKSLSELLGRLLLNSAALLGLAMILGGLVGGLIGVGAAAARRPGTSLGLILFSIVGISTPSFFLAMLLQCLEITIYKNTGTRLVPVGGFGWDHHLVLPVLVLAARHIAQVARLSHVTITDILDEDYVRTAQAKGLRRGSVWGDHIIRNAASSVLTAMLTSLRFSLSSLPLVEVVFGWPGAGKAMLDMLRTFQRTGATTLILVMGAIFVSLNILLEVVYRLLDPRLRESEMQLQVGTSCWRWVTSVLGGVWATVTLKSWRERRRASYDSHLVPRSELAARKAMTSSDGGAKREAFGRQKARRRVWLRVIAENPALLLGVLVVAGLAAIVVFGPSLTCAELTTPKPMLRFESRDVLPPLAPCTIYPLGTDAQGRDILGLILLGARRTLTIALFAVIVRLVIGGTLGFLAGWFAHSRLDRAIMGLAEVLSAFPALLLAMLIVYAIGVRQGLIAFVVALATIGWGEVMQTIRSQVMAIKPMAYIEGAVATGVAEERILTAHVLPNVWPTMLSLAFLEMGGVLMILGELGFLGVFIGGGLASEDKKGLPVMIYYDVPEWSVMLANSWRAFRSYPWATFYPALAFFAAILGFTLLGEGIRRLSERLTLSFRGVFNRYTLCIAVIVFLGARLMFESTSLYAIHTRDAATFDAGRAMEDVHYLASGAFNGRLSGTDDAHRAAEWIAAEFEELGLQPAGSDGYLQLVTDYYRDLTGMPSLVLTGPDGQELRARYGVDFARPLGRADTGGWARGDVVVVDRGEARWWWSARQISAHLGISLAEMERSDRVIMRLRASSGPVFAGMVSSGELTVSSDAALEGRYHLLTRSDRPVTDAQPDLLISPGLASQVLVGSGHRLEALQEMVAGDEGSGIYLSTGWAAEIALPARQARVQARNVIGIWPGEDVVMDGEAIVVAGYYDGLGVSPDGTLYPGANDNASGIATMLETIRTLKDQGFRPKRTMIFVAWEGGERRRVVDYERFLRAHLGFAEAYEIVAGLELEGVGAGTGTSALVWHTTRARLAEVLQKAARKVGTPLSMRGQGLHPDADTWPLPSLDVPSATISWLGSQDVAHLPSDRADNVAPDKLAQVGRMVSLALMVLANDPAY